MARKAASRRKPPSEAVKAAADRAAARADAKAKGEEYVETPKVPIDPPSAGGTTAPTAPGGELAIYPLSWTMEDVAPPLPTPGKGRPTKFTAELAEQIILRMCSRDRAGNVRAMRHICMDADMPAETTLYRWLAEEGDDRDHFREQYARARETRTEMMSDDNIVIADTELDPKRARVRIQARQWYQSKLNPKRYGDKVALTDPDGGVLKVKFEV